MKDDRISACVFCDIIRGRSEAASVYEDESFVAFMDRSPINSGHLLVLPKAHHETLLDMPGKDVGDLFATVARLAAAVKEAMGADGINIGQNNGSAAHQIVPHVHVHVIPRYENDSPEGRWPSRKAASYGELEAAAESIRRVLESSTTS
ncbi:MAG: HIT family protein [Thermoplasmata archaeon]